MQKSSERISIPRWLNKNHAHKVKSSDVSFCFFFSHGALVIRERRDGTLDEGEFSDASPANDQDLVARQVLGCKHGHSVSRCKNVCSVVVEEGRRRKEKKEKKKGERKCDNQRRFEVVTNSCSLTSLKAQMPPEKSPHSLSLFLSLIDESVNSSRLFSQLVVGSNTTTARKTSQLYPLDFHSLDTVQRSIQLRRNEHVPANSLFSSGQC